MRRYLLIVSLLFASVGAATAHAGAFVFSGVVLDQGESQLLNRFTAWFSDHAGGEWKPVYQESYRALSDYLRAHDRALGWTCGAPFVEDHARDGQQVVAVPLFQGRPLYHSLVISRIGRSEKRLEDFKGKIFAYSDPRSNSGYLAPSYTLLQRGFSIEHHFSYLLHTGLHEIRSVRCWPAWPTWVTWMSMSGSNT